MTLLISIYKIDSESEAVLFEINLPPGEELGGFEAWRETVWGSDETINLGAIFLPKLKETDLHIKGKELTAFIQECELLIEHYYDRQDIIHRLNNYINAAKRAIAINGRISIS